MSETSDDFFDRSSSPSPAPSKPIMAIYVHAGAGYHSVQNERLHLAVCRDACNAAMAILKAGGTAVEAASAAVVSLENSDLTNAGFSSNLTMEGRVEADATIIDHLGRSGACGAVPYVRNPVLLAKMILKMSQVPLSLRRVPPNLLVGKGAANFAHMHGMPLVRNELLISQGSAERFIRWKRELQNAVKIAQAKREEHNEDLSLAEAHYHSIPVTWPDSPKRAESSPPPAETSSCRSTRIFCPSKKRERSGSALNRGSTTINDADAFRGDIVGHTSAYASSKRRCGQDSMHMANLSVSGDGAIPVMGEDDIVDTVGAIAIDCMGNIAAAASSGGIGMKHRGRVGPAALVGVGAAVIPRHPDDQNEVSVATITSGTGEHMSTTLASQKCSERIYNGTRQNEHGRDVSENNEDLVVESFVANDFMKHPGVMYSPAPAAIGVLSVKQSRQGIYFYFAHNTDSFALASMTESDVEPMCVMSRRRAKASNPVARGARRTRA
ncbi:hypothetical protein TD95_000007 [Thielaviopsis punctulata]|uniref:Asparaginase n=1 Tax=Thielaviopsis punctulata TaxID=72032 RepID=A0A0F4Z814_9PEZI|nr:hypothetical protein TD95_000007 [Thielaviopsis punctulata]